MAMDKTTRYFALFVGPLILYITITLYLKDEESHAEIRSGLLGSGDRSRDEERILAQNDATIFNVPEHFFVQREQKGEKNYDEESEIHKEVKMSRDTQNQKKLTELPQRILRNDFEEDFSFDGFNEYIQPEPDSQVYKEYEKGKDVIQKANDKSFLNKIKDPEINNNDIAGPPPDTKNQKKIPKSSFGVEKEPDTKWCQKKRIRVLVLVFTHPERSYERIIARKTWFKNTPSDFTMFFVMGKPDDRTVADVNEEFEEFQDLLIGNFKDQKRSGTTKFMMAMMWFSQLQNVCKVPRYVLKTADNIYINMAALGYWIKNELPTTKNLYLGRVVRRDEPVRNRNNPRYVPRSAFQDFVFPDYLNGPQYLFSADVMHRMAYVTRLVFPIAVEDAYIGLLCHRLEIRPIWDENFHLLMKTTNVCVNAKLLFIFCKSAKEMSKLHKEINYSKSNSKCKPLPGRGVRTGL